MQQISSEQQTEYELKLLREMEEIRQRIAELEQERQALQRLLVRARQENITLGEVGRKNSLDRAVIEQKVCDELRTAGKPLRSFELIRLARSVVHNLKDSTFRSHLHRMKKRGLIRNSKNRAGVWELANER